MILHLRKKYNTFGFPCQDYLVFGSDLGFRSQMLRFRAISRAQLAPTAEKRSRI